MTTPTVHQIMMEAEKYAEAAAEFAVKGFLIGFHRAQEFLGDQAGHVSAAELNAQLAAMRASHRSVHLDSFITGAIAILKLQIGDTTAEPWTENAPGGDIDRRRLAELLERLSALSAPPPAQAEAQGYTRAEFELDQCGQTGTDLTQGRET